MLFIVNVCFGKKGHDAMCTDQVIKCDDVDKRKVGGQEVNIVAVC